MVGYIWRESQQGNYILHWYSRIPGIPCHVQAVAVPAGWTAGARIGARQVPGPPDPGQESPAVSIWGRKRQLSLLPAGELISLLAKISLYV